MKSVSLFSKHIFLPFYVKYKKIRHGKVARGADPSERFHRRFYGNSYRINRAQLVHAGTFSNPLKTI